MVNKSEDNKEIPDMCPVPKPVQMFVLMRGLPGCGKSTLAQQIIEESPTTIAPFIRINRDDLRTMLKRKWSRKLEGLVVQLERDAIWSAITCGWSVIVDDTNLTQQIYDMWMELANRLLDSRNIIVRSLLDVPFETILERNAVRDDKTRVSPERLREMQLSIYNPPID